MPDFLDNKSAAFSASRKYRYSLWRWWDRSKPYALFIGLNPSTADETKDDPTIRRCVRFARDWGYGGLCMANLFAFRATKPAVMLEADDPVGMMNDGYLEWCSGVAGIVIAAWGTNGAHMGRDIAVMSLIPRMVQCLRLTRAGFPGHPLYIPADTKPVVYAGRNVS